MLYKTHWAGLSEPSWEREMGLHLSRSHILRYWAGTPDQHRQTNRLYRRMRIGTAQRELSRNNGERFLAPGYACVPRAEWLRGVAPPLPRYGAPQWSPLLVQGRRWAVVAWKNKCGYDGGWVYLVRFSDDPGPIKLPFSPARYTTSTGAVRGSWCLQVHAASAFCRGVQRNVDYSRGAAVVS